MPNALAAFLDAASPGQRAALAHAAETTLPQLKHIIAGRREASAKLGARIEKVAALLRRTSARLPALDRRDIAAVCGCCPFAKAA